MALKTDSGRLRAVSTTSVTAADDEDVASLVRSLERVDASSWTKFEDHLTDSGFLQQLRFLLKDNDQDNDPRDSFRRAKGFEAIISLCETLSKVWIKLGTKLEENKNGIRLLSQLLAVLEAAVGHHAGNNKYFRLKIEGGGWRQIQNILQALLVFIQENEDCRTLLQQFFGVLLATSVGAEVISDIYTNAQKLETTNSDLLEDGLQRILAGDYELVLPELLQIMTLLWSQHLSSTERQSSEIQLAFPLSLQILLSMSRRNLVAAHSANLFGAIRPLLFDGNHSAQEKEICQELALLLCEEGISHLEDAHFLFSKAVANASSSSFLLRALEASQQSPSIQFDLSRLGSSSIELGTIRRPFPPTDTPGYSLALWARFDHFDSGAHTTLFGTFDKTQTCFVLTYLEKDTRHLILQTATKGSRPSVRFKSVVFESGRWYHICITHRRPKTITSSKAYLFVNGEFMEQVKSSFPAAAPIEKSTGTVKVQAFLGTPQDLAPNSSNTNSTSQWSLASAMLLQGILSDDLVAVMYHLGPKYHGNLQDCLGSFQTYGASAALNLRNESLNPGKEDASDLIKAIRHKGGDLIDENSILLNISPAAILDGDDQNNIDESQLIKSLSKIAAKNLHAYTRAGANAIAINGAVPAINDALVQTNGVAMLMGEPVVTVPQSLDDISWRLGGCAPVGLCLLHKARTTEEVAVAVDILLEIVQSSWRNSEIMERHSGYNILSNLIRDKLEGGRTTAAIPTPNLDRQTLGIRLLKSLLSFLGYDEEDETRSIISNPLAYKVLLIDSSIWRCHSAETQQLYFRQITAFAAKGLHSKFNLKRLNRMRALKRLLEALKSEPVSRSTMSLYAAAFSALLPTSMTAETLRSIALFVTYSVHKRHNNSGRPRRSLNRETRARSSSDPSSSSQKTIPSEDVLSQFDIGVEVLRLYSNMLCTKGDTSMIKKFAKTVTNKWLLYLLSESSPEVVVLSVRILARLLVVHGEAYLRKFKDKTGGFTIMAHRLKRWWHMPALWPACFAILFGVDVAELDLERSFDLFGFVDVFDSRRDYSVRYPEMLEVIIKMLQSGLKTIVSAKEHLSTDSAATATSDDKLQAPQRLSMSTMAPPNPFMTLATSQNIDTFSTIIGFLADLHSRSAKFREFAATSSYIDDLLSVLFPVVVGSDIVDASVELNARDSMLSFDGTDVIVNPLTKSMPLMKALEKKPSTVPQRGKMLRRGSSYIVVTREQTRHSPSVTESEQHSPLVDPAMNVSGANKNHTIVQGLLEIVISVFLDQLLARKDFPGLGLFLKTPPGFVEHQHYFESWILRNTVSQLSNSIALNQNLLLEPRVLTNLARFFVHLGDSLFEGWFVDGAEAVLDLSGSILEYLQREDVAQLKSVRLCMQAISTIRSIVFRVVLLNLSHVEDSESIKFLGKLAYWQNVLLSAEDASATHLQHICYLLYASLISSQAAVRMAAANLWRIILVQKPNEAAAILGQADTQEQKRLVSRFEKLVELDNETFIHWLDEHRKELDTLFFDTLSRSWDLFVTEENRRSTETARARSQRRRERLKTLTRDEADREELIRRHEVTFDYWTTNIYSSENLKHHRLMQDQQDDRTFTETIFYRMQRELARSTGLGKDDKAVKWRLDQTEGRNRMRMRLLEDFTKETTISQPKRKGSDIPMLRIETRGSRASSTEPNTLVSALDTSLPGSPRQLETSGEPFPDIRDDNGDLESNEVEESFEIIDDPNNEQDEFEDKNRKVMRSLHRGDQVKNVANISRIVGLEAVEGLLILGKDHIYLIDNFFQRADGEIVNVWQAPQEERDPYVRMISGRDVAARKPAARADEHEARSWKWSEVISVSKRRFLFRDVAIEMFFGDGRSYLVTVQSTASRNNIYSLIVAKAPQYGSVDSPQSESAWRYETLKSAEEEPQTLGSRFANVFSNSTTFTATRKWQKGEMSNFHYLMLINTMAGRTYNDLTQYPIFPWVISDYTSSELDLTDPRSFRDLSKPMGCQSAERETEFRERYRSFAEMDASTPAFHYGTHYSSAMIVSSYLVRLQPFVKSYLLLQGGSFDHPDRMFYSINDAWKSASKTNMTDVRELTPEFYYLPEFLENPNDYDFGKRQNSTSISSVELPPWAKGDPRLFISKQREALESPHVSKDLHKWIDLVFGCKQKGEAAIEAVNVFHYLSYQGAKDLDAIHDPMERLATIGIIHNFGQTPYQIFPRTHPARENSHHKYKRLDTAAESLTRLPATLLDSEEKVASLSYAWKTDKLLCSGAFRLNIPPTYDKYMEWGFFDGSVRFYSADSRKQIGLFEHLHIGQLSCALFTDSKTLITSGTDCTIGVWSLISTNKTVDLQPRATLFGHHRPAVSLSLSRSFNALLSASGNGELMLWDLNRCELARKIETSRPLQIECTAINDVTGNIVVCHGSFINMYTLNGDFLLSQDTTDRVSSDDTIVSVACYEGAGNEWLERDILFTGHKRGIVRVWSKIINPRAGLPGEASFELELIRQLNHVDPTREDGGNIASAISCILAMPQVVYTGDEDGRVCEWNCVQRH